MHLLAIMHPKEKHFRDQRGGRVQSSSRAKWIFSMKDSKKSLFCVEEELS